MINDVTIEADKQFDDFMANIATKPTEAESELARVFFRAGFLRGTVSLAKSIKEIIRPNEQRLESRKATI